MKRIVAILFTFSWRGFSVRYEDGTQQTMSPAQLYAQVGAREYERLNAIAHTNGLTGHWHDVPPAVQHGGLFPPSGPYG
jgi:hypothetical protein